MSLAEDVRAGLTASPKRIPSVHFYDERGSKLFEEITRQPEYYLTETERAILRSNADDILAAARDGHAPLALVELGAGIADKTRVLIEALLKLQGESEYVPIDISGHALEEAERVLTREYPDLAVRPVVGRNRAALASLDWGPGAPPRLVLFIGSNIGNFAAEDAVRFLADVAALMRPQDALLLGTDMLKGEDVLVPAYFDAAGVTTEFNLNLLDRINRELGADFDRANYRHEARFNREKRRMESHLVSLRSHEVRVPALDIVARFEEGESLHTENSHKYAMEDVTEMSKRAGLIVEESWFDARRWFGLHLLRTRGA